LITEKRIRRKKLNAQAKKDNWAKTKQAHTAYEKLLSKFLKEKKAAHKASTQPKETQAASPVKVAAPTKQAPKDDKAKGTKAPPAKVVEKKPKEQEKPQQKPAR